MMTNASRVCAMLLAATLVLLVGANAEGQLAKDGKYTSRYDWTFDGQVYPLDKDRVILVGNLPGIVTNDAGTGFMHNTRWDCQILWDSNKGQSTANGSCLMTDADGDKALAFWKCFGKQPICEGDFQWAGGTGKYTGITGNNTFTGHLIGATQAGYSIFKGEWHLP